MRPILALVILVLCVSKASPEPEYFSLLAGSYHLGGEQSPASLVEIESSLPRADRERINVPRAAISVPSPAARTATAAPISVPASANVDAASVHSPDPGDASNDQPVTLDALCQALLASAQENDLPIAFFANLIWQESGLRNDVVSSKGAMGIAQFMPQTAVENDLKNPFDPLQALPASARLLRELREQFGNLGFVAAAYNAGAKRVSQWLQRGRSLPRETRGYVLDITGRTVEQWRTTPPDDVDLRFVRRLPCRGFPAFAELEQARSQQAGLDRQQAQQAQTEKPEPAKLASAEKVETKPDARRERRASPEHAVMPRRGDRVRTGRRERASAGHEVKEPVRRPPRERHKRA